MVGGCGSENDLLFQQASVGFPVFVKCFRCLRIGMTYQEDYPILKGTV